MVEYTLDVLPNVLFFRLVDRHFLNQFQHLWQEVRLNQGGLMVVEEGYKTRFNAWMASWVGSFIDFTSKRSEHLKQFRGVPRGKPCYGLADPSLEVAFMTGHQETMLRTQRVPQVSVNFHRDIFASLWRKRQHG